MSTPNSTTRPSKPIPRATALTPASASSPPAQSSASGGIRSVPSPAYLSNPKLGFKSPNFQNGYAQHAMGGAVAMSRVGTNTSSPSAAMMMAIGGVGFGAETPGALGTDVVGANAMGNDGAQVRDREEERTRKIEEIVRILGGRWGRMCPEGVERCARRVGLECLWEEGAAGRRTLSIAGNGVLVDVEFVGQEVVGVVLSLPGSSEGVGSGVGEGAKVLRTDLKGNGDGGYVMLDQFVGNLERLASMDGLGREGVSCFDAVYGIYKSLERIYEWEFEKLRKEKSMDFEGEAAEKEILCKSSGRPRMNTRGRVGLALQYWIDRRLIARTKRKSEEMDIDIEPPTEIEEEPQIYSAIIECEASPSELYPSIRVSSAWFSSPIEKPLAPQEPDLFSPNNNNNNDTSQINWQEPSPTFISPEATENVMNVDSVVPLLQSKPPDVRFVARFDPPIVVPLQTAINIYESVGAPVTQESFQPTTYDSLLFAHIDSKTKPPALNISSTNNDYRTTENTITSYNAAGAPTTHRHKYTLFTQQQEFARLIDNVPFSHPRQLIAILPILRQWALAGSILRRSFVANDPEVLSQEPLQGSDINVTEFPTLEDELADLLSSSPPSPTSATPAAFPIDISLSTTQTGNPRFMIICPYPSHSSSSSSSQLSSIIFTIAPNGLIEVSESVKEGKNMAGEKAKADTKEALGKVLRIAEDIGVLIAWLGMEKGEV